MIQGGDPDSKKATPTTQLGTGDAGYRLKAEILYPQLFHKRGALAAARQGDEINPNRESSGCQFYIVWGDIYKGGQLAQIEKQMEMMQQKAIFDRLVKENYNTIKSLRLNRDNDGLMALQEELIAKMQQEIKEVGVAKLTNEQKEVYSTIGGTPHLDGQYTVFGEVIEGLDIVEQIQQVATGTADRPKEDIKMEMEIC